MSPVGFEIAEDDKIWTPEKIASYIDHTKLGPTVTSMDVETLCEEARKHKFHSVCVPSIWTTEAKNGVKDSDVLVCVTVGFPHGNMYSRTKQNEASQAILDGADEIDVVMNLALFKDESYCEVMKEIEGLAHLSHRNNTILKVIIETCYLDDSEIIKATSLASLSGVDFIKTSTGYGSAGATVEHVALMAKHAGRFQKIKASGGIRTFEDAMAMIDAGASRLGTSRSVDIIKGPSVE